MLLTLFLVVISLKLYPYILDFNSKNFEPPHLFAGASQKMISSGTNSGLRQRVVFKPWTRERLERERAITLSYSQPIDARFWTNSSALNSYLEFVKIHNFSVNPTADTLSFFTVFMSFHTTKPDLVDTYLSKICQQLELFFPDARKNRKSALVKHTLKGCKRMYAHSGHP